MTEDSKTNLENWSVKPGLFGRVVHGEDLKLKARVAAVVQAHVLAQAHQAGQLLHDESLGVHEDQSLRFAGGKV